MYVRSHIIKTLILDLCNNGIFEALTDDARGERTVECISESSFLQITLLSYVSSHPMIPLSNR